MVPEELSSLIYRKNHVHWPATYGVIFPYTYALSILSLMLVLNKPFIYLFNSFIKQNNKEIFKKKIKSTSEINALMDCAHLMCYFDLAASFSLSFFYFIF